MHLIIFDPFLKANDNSGCLTVLLPSAALLQQGRQDTLAAIQLHTNLPFEKSILGARAQDIRFLPHYLFKKRPAESFKVYKHLPFSNQDIKKHNYLLTITL